MRRLLALTRGAQNPSNSGFCQITGKCPDETHLSALCRPPKAHAWFPCPHADPRRPGGNPGASRQGPGPARCLTETARYRKDQRLTGPDIALALASGKPRRERNVSMQVRPNGMAFARLGMIVPKRVLARAVDRNRARRLLREWFRNNQGRFGGRDLLVRVSARRADLNSLLAEVERLCPAE